MRIVPAVAALVLAIAIAGIAAQSVRADAVTVDWAAAVPATPPVQIGGMVASGDGVVVAGYVDGVIDGETSAGYSDIYLVRFNANGSVAWTLQFGTPFDESFGALDGAPDGPLFVAGTTTGVFGTSDVG